MRWLGNLAVGLITTPLIMFLIPVYALVHDPSLAVELWAFYLPWIFLPMLAGTALWLYSRKQKPVDKAKPVPEKPE